MIRVVLLLLLFLTGVGVLSSCKTTQTTLQVTRDTMVSLRSVSIPFDTNIAIRGGKVRQSFDVPCIDGMPQMPQQTLKVGNTNVNAEIKNGVLIIDAAQNDTTIEVKGNAKGKISDTTFHTTITKTVEKKLTWWGKLGQGIKNVLLWIAILIVIIFFFIIINPAFK